MVPEVIPEVAFLIAMLREYGTCDVSGYSLHAVKIEKSCIDSLIARVEVGEVLQESDDVFLDDLTEED